MLFPAIHRITVCHTNGRSVISYAGYCLLAGRQTLAFTPCIRSNSIGISSFWYAFLRKGKLFHCQRPFRSLVCYKYTLNTKHNRSWTLDGRFCYSFHILYLPFQKSDWRQSKGWKGIEHFIQVKRTFRVLFSFFYYWIPSHTYEVCMISANEKELFSQFQALRTVYRVFDFFSQWS